MKNCLIGLFNAVIAVLLSGAVFGEEIDIITLVVDEDGSPIEGAEVTFRYIHYQQNKDYDKKVITGKDGKAQCIGMATLRAQVFVSKEGYYQTKSDRLRRDKKHNFKSILRRKIKPIPLYVKKAYIGMPLNHTWCGYDFEIGDFVAPHGVGKTTDIEFKVDAVPVLPNGSIIPGAGDGLLEIRFPNKHEGLLYVGDGYLQNSMLRMPHEAPDDGYQSTLTKEGESNKINTGVFLRIRAKERQGQLYQAHYVKIGSDILFDPRETGWHVSDKGKPKKFGGVIFTYYFNPTPNDRNLEFDPQKNLFGDLPSEERVLNP